MGGGESPPTPGRPPGEKVSSQVGKKFNPHLLCDSGHLLPISGPWFAHLKNHKGPSCQTVKGWARLSRVVITTDISLRN